MTAPPDTFPSLPALKHLGDLASVRPVIVVDSREQIPLPIRRLASTVATLTSGDYSFAGGEELFAVERKSIPDLVQCCMGDNRARFERELHRLRGFRFARLLIVGTRAEVEGHQYRSNISPRAVLHTLAAFEARYVPVVWAPDPDSAARLVETWAWWFARELVINVNKVWRSTPSPEDESREAGTAGAKE
jgi:ERCC4-type nuclease